MNIFRAVAFVFDRIGFKQIAWNIRFKHGITYGGKCPNCAARVSDLANGGSIVEHGCGIGTLPSQLRPESFNSYVGYDISNKGVSMAEKAFPEWRFRQLSMEDWQGEEELIDVIVCREVVYYLETDALRQFLKRALASLRPTGAVLITIHDAVKHASTVATLREYDNRDEISDGGSLTVVLRNRNCAPN